MNILRTCIRVSLAALLAASLAGGAWAAGSSSESPSRGEAQKLDQAEDAIEAGDYRAAVPLLTEVVAAEPDNADAYNYLGYAHRKLGDLETSKRYYDRALAIDPDHRGANEYLGELYLTLDQLDKAEERLARLDKVCFFGCAEYDDLKAAIEAYKARAD